MARRVLEAILVSLLVLTFGTSGAFSKPIDIRSGEHEGFSRLVLTLPTDVDWQFGKVEGGFEFRPSSADITYALGSVFQRIPRDRIGSVTDRGAGRLFLAVDCDCHADAFELRDGMVVLDIKDGTPLPSARVFNRVLPEDESSLMNTANTLNAQSLANGPSNQDQIVRPAPDSSEVTIPPSPRRARNGLPLFMGPGRMLELDPDQSDDTMGDRPSREHDDVIADTADSGPGNTTGLPMAGDMLSQQIFETEMALLEQIGRAASQGVLEANTTVTEELIAPPVTLPTDSEDSTDEGSVDSTIAMNEGGSGPASHFSVQTAMTQNSVQDEQGSGVNQDGLICPADEYFDVGSWGVEMEGAADLGNFRANLLGEFDRVRPDMVLAQIRRDIFLTFGAEAKMLLRVYDPEIDRKDILLILADIVDTFQSPNGSFLNQYMDCDGLVSLWAVLAQPQLSPGQPLNVSAISFAFSELPAHLRRYFGPSLISKLISIDQHELATSIQNATNRAEGESNTKATYLNAQIAMGQGESTQAIDFLDQVIRSGSDLAPNAILDLLTYKMSNDLEVTDGDITLAASHAFELRGTEIGRDLNRLEIVALAKTLRFSDAFERLEIYRDRGDISAETAGDLENQIISELVENGADAPFLRFLVPNPHERDLPQELRSKVAKRLVDLGFVQEGRIVLSQSDDVPSGADRILFARMALAEEKYDVALSYLVGMEGAEALFLQGLAHEGRQEFSSSAKLFDFSGASEKQLSAAWRAGQWNDIQALDSGVIGQAGRLMLTSVDHPKPQETNTGTLMADQDLLSQSQESRAVIAGLLSELTVPE